MYLIDETYFNKSIAIPNLNELGDALNDLESYIDEYVPLLLRECLGLELYSDFEANQNATKWSNLLNGVEYVKDGITYKWLGLLQTNGISKKSLLSNFVFYHWLTDKVSEVSQVGSKVTTIENTNSVSSINRLVKVWNEFINEYQGTCTHFPDIYYKGGIQVVDWFGTTQQSNFVSLIQFLIDNETDYPNATLKRYQFKNTLGL